MKISEMKLMFSVIYKKLAIVMVCNAVVMSVTS